MRCAVQSPTILVSAPSDLTHFDSEQIFHASAGVVCGELPLYQGNADELAAGLFNCLPVTGQA